MRLERLIALALLTLTSSLPAIAEDVAIGGRTLHLEPNGQFCALDRRNQIDATLLDMAASLQRGYNQLLAYWVDCSQLALYRNGESDELTPYVMVLAQLAKSGAAVPADLALDKYLAETRQSLAKNGDGKDIFNDAGETMRKRVDETLNELGATGVDLGIGETRGLGVLAQDDFAIYLGLLQRVSVNGRESLVGAIVAITELNGFSASVNVYGGYERPESFDALRAHARQIVSGLVAENPTVPKRGYDWSQLIERGFIGAIVGLVIAGVVGLFRRWARWS